MSIGPGYVRLMAAYNAEMNRRLYAAAASLSDTELRLHRGAFWGSIHGTLAHLVWGDLQWMGRFDNWRKHGIPLRDSASYNDDFDALRVERIAIDSRLEAWAARVDQAWLDGELVWFSGASGREQRRPMATLIPHFFNHQTHHRGQVHAMLTAAGAQTGDTDLFLVV